jgi:hypothetical protein
MTGLSLKSFSCYLAVNAQPSKGRKMKSYLTLIYIAMLGALLSACASTPAPKAGATLSVAPTSVTQGIPSWFIEQPESTAEFVYVVGTAISRDISMSGHKAQLDAETHLANKIAGEINTLTKDFKRDLGDEFVQSTEIVSSKIATDVKVIGGVIVKKQVTPEGGGFRTYVLLKFPLGSNNQMLQNHISRSNFQGSKDAAERELRQRGVERRTVEVNPIDPQVAAENLGVDNSGIVIRETRATSTSGPLGLADAKEEN